MGKRKMTEEQQARRALISKLLSEADADKTDCFHNRSHHILFYCTILRLHRIWD